MASEFLGPARNETPRPVFLARSDDGGRSFATTKVYDAPDGNPDRGLNKGPMLAVDPSAPERVYVGWRQGIFAIDLLHSAESGPWTDFTAPNSLREVEVGANLLLPEVDQGEDQGLRDTPGGLLCSIGVSSEEHRWSGRYTRLCRARRPGRVRNYWLLRVVTCAPKR